MNALDIDMTLTDFLPEENTEPSKGNRKLPEILLCSISQDGIEFYSNSPQILSFEIQDKSGNIVGIFVDEFDFIEVLFSLQGEYKLVFTTPDYYLTGWITL